MKKDIVIIAQYLQLEKEKGNSRFTYLAKMLVDYDVEIITSNFFHSQKKHREEKYLEENNYSVTMLDEPGYLKNVSLKRFYSHFILSRNIKKYLKTRKKPDLVFCSVPSFDTGLVASNYCKKHNIPFIIDIQDLWPEAFKMAFNPPLISGLIYSPFKFIANKVYKNADEIVAVSETYKERGLLVNRKDAKGISVFLGTELSTFDKYKTEIFYENKLENEFWIAYIGTLGTSYNINIITDALSILKAKGYENIKFIVMGDGPLRHKFQEYAKDKDIYCEFTGRLDYPTMVGLLCACDIAVNPIISSASGSIINKVADYAAAGLAVISTQECQEYKDLVTNYEIGFNLSNDAPDAIAEKIEFLYDNRDITENMGKNNRKLAEEMFDRKYTYLGIIKYIKDLLSSNRNDGEKHER